MCFKKDSLATVSLGLTIDEYIRKHGPILPLSEEIVDALGIHNDVFEKLAPVVEEIYVLDELGEYGAPVSDDYDRTWNQIQVRRRMDAFLEDHGHLIEGFAALVLERSSRRTST